ncbi:MAG: polysaccharide lyase [Bacteroidota bacterium]
MLRKSRRRKSLLSLMVVAMLSCKKQEIQPPATAEKEQEDLSLSIVDGITLTSSKLLYEETFESDGPYFYKGEIQSGTPYGFTLATNLVYQGKKAGRFELKDTDPLTSGGTRAEAKYPDLTHPNRWYSFAVYFPSSEYKYDSEAEIISQWHQGKGVSPSMSVITRYNKIYLEIRTTPKIKTQFLLGDIVKNKWQTFVFHILHSNKSNGITEVWQDGRKIFTKTGANAYSFNKYDKPNWKFGLYKWEWNGSGKTDTKKRVLYFDNIRVGNEFAAFRDMIHSGHKTIPSAVINSFTLVNAETDKAIRTIRNGAVISLSALPSERLTIRANPGAFMRSIKFELTGPQNRVYTDDAKPFSLNGDDEKGNYYAGAWNPPRVGNYTLKATPYSDYKAAGLIGKTAIINFKIVR